MELALKKTNKASIAALNVSSKWCTKLLLILKIVYVIIKKGNYLLKYYMLDLKQKYCTIWLSIYITLFDIGTNICHVVKYGHQKISYGSISIPMNTMLFNIGTNGYHAVQHQT